jgi:hypothetical protein
VRASAGEFLLQRDQSLGVDGLDLRHDQRRTLQRDQRAQRVAVEHAQHMTAMCDLHRRRIGVAVGHHHLAAEALQLDRDFLAQLAAAEQQHAQSEGRERGSEFEQWGCGHGASVRVLDGP